MIGKDQQPLIEQYTQTIVEYIDTQRECKDVAVASDHAKERYIAEVQ